MRIHPHPQTLIARKGERVGDPTLEDITFDDLKDDFIKAHSFMARFEDDGAVQWLIHSERALKSLSERCLLLIRRSKITRRIPPRIAIP